MKPIVRICILLLAVSIIVVSVLPNFLNASDDNELSERLVEPVAAPPPKREADVAPSPAVESLPIVATKIIADAPDAAGTPSQVVATSVPLPVEPSTESPTEPPTQQLITPTTAASTPAPLVTTQEAATARMTERATAAPATVPTTVGIPSTAPVESSPAPTDLQSTAVAATAATTSAQTPATDSGSPPRHQTAAPAAPVASVALTEVVPTPTVAAETAAAAVVVVPSPQQAAPVGSAPQPPPPLRTDATGPDATASIAPATELVITRPSLPPGERIPRRMHVIWKTETLISEAAKLDAEWREKEPTFTRHVVTDAECKKLADRVPGLQPWYDRLPLNVMRADVCRVMVVYFNGGIYMDLDVKWVKPLSEWFNVSLDIVLGKEYDDGSAFCNWFFAAEPGHHCIKRVLYLIISRINRTITKADFQDNPGLVHVTTGPKTFAHGLRDCAKAVLTSAQITHTHVKHLYASHRWSGTPGYKSWHKDRMEFVGWKTPQGNAMLSRSQKRFMTMPVHEVLGPVDERSPPITITGFAQSSYRFDHLPFLASAALAVDNNLESFLQTGRDGVNTATFTLQESLKTPSTTVAAPDETSNALRCIKLINRRDGEFGHLGRVSVELRSGNASAAAVGGEFSVDDGVATFKVPPTTGPPAEFRTIAISRRGELSFAELQLFTDPSCAARRKLVVAAPEVEPPFSNTSTGAWEASTRDLIQLITTRTFSCNDAQIIGDFRYSDTHWPLCVSPQLNGSVAIVVRRSEIIERYLLDLGLNVHVLDPRFDKPLTLESTPLGSLWLHRAGVSSAQSFAEVLAPTNASVATVLKLDLGGQEWSYVDRLCEAAKARKVEQVLVDLRVGGKDWSPTKTFELIGRMTTLLKHFHVVGSRISERGPGESTPFNFASFYKILLLSKATAARWI